MAYQPKIILCRLKTGGKTIQEIRERHKGQGLTYRDFENIQKANEQFDGLKVQLSVWDYDNGEYYHLFKWEIPDDEKMMIGVYYAEQTHPRPIYKDNFEEFRRDWLSGEYDSRAALVFHRDDVEEIEIISEEVEEQPPPYAPHHSKKKKKKGRKKK